MSFFKKIDNNLPASILIISLFYSLGASLAHFFGNDINLVEYLLGLFWALSMHVAAKSLLMIRIIFTNNSEELLIINDDEHKKFQIFLFGIFFISMVLVTILILDKTHQIYLWTLFLSSYVVLFVIPHIIKNNSAVTTVLISIFQSSLVPAIAYNLFISGINRTLTLLVLPLTLITIAVNIALEFSTYANDEIKNRRTIIRTIGWKRGILLHHLFLIGSFIFLFLFVGKGIPTKFMVPTTLTSPLVLLNIFWLQRIKAGNKPVWPFFNTLSLSIVCMIVYLFTYTLWIN